MRLATRIGVALVVVQWSPWLVSAEDAETAPREPEPPSRIKPGVFHLDFREAYLGLEADYQARRVRSSAPGRGDATQKNRNLRLAETLGLGLSGDIVDPNLVDWRAGAEFGLTQGWFDEALDGRNESDRDSGILLEYDVAFDVLKTKPLSVHAYARRGDDRIPRRFLPSLRETRTEAGVSALALTGPATTEVGFSWRDTDRAGNLRDEDAERLEVGRFYVDNKWEFGDTHSLRLTYDHEREESTYQGSDFDFTTDRDELRVEHELGFGSESKHRLDTFFRYNEEDGTLARDEVEFVPRLSLQHTDKLRTVYRYGFHRFEQGAIEIDQHKVDAQALYQATEHLRLSLDGYGLYEDVKQDVETREFGGGFDASYRRPTSLGELSANARVAFDRARTHGDTGRRIVRGEAHQLGGSRPIYLREIGVVLGTILAYDVGRTRIYIAGLDYTVVVTSGRARIRRVLTGRITENETVYFDYAYEVPTHATEDTYRTDLLFEHRFTFGLTPYYYFEGRFQEVDPSPATPRARDNMNRHRFGLRYGPQRWTVGAEYEIFDDSVEPYDAVHLTGQAAVLRSRAHSLDLSAELSHYRFEGGVDRRRVWWADLDLRDRYHVNRYWALLTGAAYRWEDDSIDGTTHGVDLECGMQYTRGYLSVELTVEYDLLALAENRDDGFGFFLNVRRDLSHLFTARETR